MFEISHGAPLAPCTAHLCRIKVFAVSIPMPWRAPELFAAMLRIINLQGALRILTAFGLTLCRAPGSERSTGGDPLGTAWSDAVRRACGGSGGGETWREEQGVEGMKGGDDEVEEEKRKCECEGEGRGEHQGPDWSLRPRRRREARAPSGRESSSPHIYTAAVPQYSAWWWS